ncbi:GAF and ANTAR domain-containing protein [Nocardia farcinica]|nr:GAF and ANTAR domain-containing protein [Nocardia farcinica]
MAPESRSAPVTGTIADAVHAQPAVDQLVAAFARMSGFFLTAGTAGTALKLITSLATEMVAPTSGAGISMLDGSGARMTAAATGEVVEEAVSLQYQLGAGPCLTAWADRVVVRVDDFGTDQRWPEWSRRAARLGLASSLSAPLVAGTQALGAIKIYGARPGICGQREEHLLSMFSSQAAMLLAHMRAADDAERVSGLIAESLRGRDVINLAKGIIMARDRVDERGAFLILASTARNQNVPVRRVAERVAMSTVPRRR